MLLAAGESPSHEPGPNDAKAHGTNGSSQHEPGKSVYFHQTEELVCILTVMHNVRYDLMTEPVTET